MRALAALALAASLITACTIQLDLPGDDDGDDDGPRSGFFPCPGCPDGGWDDTTDAGPPWWDSDAGPPHGDAGCGDSDGGIYTDAGWGYTPDAGPAPGW